MQPAKWIQRRRLERDLSVEALGDALAVGADVVEAWEAGASSPDPESMARLEAVLSLGADHPPWWPEALSLKDQMPLRDLAQHLGVGIGALSAELRKAGVRRRLRVQADHDQSPPQSPPSDPMTEANDTTSESGPPRSGSKDALIEQYFHLLGNIPDSEVARLADVSVRTVASYRARNSIEGYDGPRRRPKPRGGKKSKLEDYKHMLGKLPDRVIAEEAGMSLGAVRNFRIKNGVDAAGRMPKAEIARVLAALRGSAAPDEALPPEPGEVATAAAMPARAAAPPAAKPVVAVSAGSQRVWRFHTDRGDFLVVASSLGQAVALAATRAGGEHGIQSMESLGEAFIAA